MKRLNIVISYSEADYLYIATIYDNNVVDSICSNTTMRGALYLAIKAIVSSVKNKVCTFSLPAYHHFVIQNTPYSSVSLEIGGDGWLDLYDFFDKDKTFVCGYLKETSSPIQTIAFALEQQTDTDTVHVSVMIEDLNRG